jgi:hypothetical protein
LSNGSVRQLAQQATKHTAVLQQLHNAALKGALLRFGAQRRAFYEVLATLFGKQLLKQSSSSDWECSTDYLCRVFCDPDVQQLLEEAYEAAQDRGVKCIRAPEQLLPALCVGREQLQQLRHRVGQEMQKHGIGPGWFTLSDVGAAAGAVSSDSDSGSDSDSPRRSARSGKQRSSSGGGSKRGCFSSWQRLQQEQQQQSAEGTSELAAAIAVGGQGLRWAVLLAAQHTVLYNPACRF